MKQEFLELSQAAVDGVGKAIESLEVLVDKDNRQAYRHNADRLLAALEDIHRELVFLARVYQVEQEKNND